MNDFIVVKNQLWSVRLNRCAFFVYIETEWLQITFILTGGTLLIFFQSGFEKLLLWLGIRPQTLDLSPHSGTLDIRPWWPKSHRLNLKESW